MNRFLTIRRLSFIFFGLFAVVLAGVFAFQLPGAEAEQRNLDARGGHGGLA